MLGLWCRAWYISSGFKEVYKDGTMNIQSSIFIVLCLSVSLGCERRSRMSANTMSELGEKWGRIDSGSEGISKFSSFAEDLNSISTSSQYIVYIDDVIKICGEPDISCVDGSYYGYLYMESDCAGFEMAVMCSSRGEVKYVAFDKVNELMLDTNRIEIEDPKQMPGLLQKYIKSKK